MSANNINAVYALKLHTPRMLLLLINLKFNMLEHL